MIRVAIIGATGYTALELIKILLRHPEVEITALTSRSEGNPHVASVHPQLAGRINLPMADLGPSEIGARADVAFSCLPHGVTASLGTLDDRRDPSRGVHALADVRRAVGRSADDPGYEQWRLDGRAYLPVFAKRRVLALRGVFAGITKKF